MNFKSKTFSEGFGEKAGYVFSYLLFSTILFILLVLLKKIPESWNYFYILPITFLIASAGWLIKRFLL